MEVARRRQLSGVKYQMYHPWLPTLRRMDMDTMVHKLTNEHSRHTTYCTQMDFVNNPSLVPGQCRNDVVNPQASSKVQHYKHLPSFCKNTDTKKGNQSNQFIIRKWKPDINSSWRQVLQEREQHSFERPISANLTPATMLTNYRNTIRPHSAYPWY